LLGRVGADPDIPFSTEGSGHTWARFSVATEAPGSADDKPDWHTVVARDRLAQFVARYVTKGRLVYVSGWLTYRSMQGKDHSTLLAQIQASKVLLLDRPALPDRQHDEHEPTPPPRDPALGRVPDKRP
jgi:single-strand DNA-binding protein